MTPLIQSRKTPNYKSIFESLDILNGINKDHFVTLVHHGSSWDMTLANLKKGERGFHFSFEHPHSYQLKLGDVSNIRILTSEFTLCASKIFINRISGATVSGMVSDFKTESFNKETLSYFRVFIPIEEKIDFIFYINRIGYRTKKHSSGDCIRTNYQGLDIDLYLYHDKEKDDHYLIIDASEKLSFHQFSDYCFATLVSFGYITGKMSQNEGYFFTYDQPTLKVPNGFYYSELRGSLTSMYTPIYRNAFGYMNDRSLLKEAVEMNRTLRTLTAEEFSRLCQWAYNSVEFSSILLLIIESSSSSLLVMPSGLAVALEGITDLIVKQNEGKLAPIKDKAKAKKFRAQLQTILATYAQDVDLVGLQILKSRIDNINQLTNQAKLTKPFELLKFKLTDEDIKAIDHRNDFLHGRLTLAIEGNIKRVNHEIYYITLRLYTLLSVLILKSVGYDGKIVNYPVIHNSIYKKLLNEPYFRQV
jgi:hypothetical protein